MSNPETTLGATLHVSSTVVDPSALNAQTPAARLAALKLLTFTKVGALETVGTIASPWDSEEYLDYEDGLKRRVRTTRDAGQFEATIRRLYGDAGQVILETNYNTPGDFRAFKLEHANGRIQFFAGDIPEFPDNYGAAGAIKKTDVKVNLHVTFLRDDSGVV